MEEYYIDILLNENILRYLKTYIYTHRILKLLALIKEKLSPINGDYSVLWTKWNICITHFPGSGNILEEGTEELFQLKEGKE